MFMSRLEFLLRPFQMLGRSFKSRPKTSLTVAILLVPLAVWGGVFLWSHSHRAAAEHALDDDDLVAARELVDSSLKIWPDDTSAHLLAARIERLAGNFPRVEEHLDECKRIAGMTEALQLEWCLLRAQSGELSQVEDGLWLSVKQDHPRSLLILEALTFAYMSEMRYITALGCLNWWLKKQPNTIRALDWRGWVHGKLEHKEGMYEDYQRVLQLAPNHWKTRLRLVYALLLDSDTKAARHHLGLIEAAHGDDPEVLVARAQCQVLLGKVAEARRLLDELLRREPNNASALYERGRLADAPAEKEAYFRQALKVQPTLVEARFQLYHTLMQEKRSQEAEAELKQYQKSTGDVKKLEGLLRQLERMPQNPDLLAQIGEILLPGQEDVGERVLRKALEADPRHQKSHAILARHYEKKNQPQRAAYHANLAAQTAAKVSAD
jgi:tetratricopeptide (TPR) repeat protein